MPFVSGFLRVRRRRPGTGGPVDPDYGIEGPAEPGQPLPPDGEGPVDPDYGIEGPEIDEPGPPGIWPSPGRPSHPIFHPRPKPPPGIWPPPTPSHPIQPVPPEPPSVGGGLPHPEHPIAPGGEYPSQLPTVPSLPPGMIWPPPNAVGKFVVLAWIPGQGWKFIVIDAGLKPTHPIAPGGPDAPEPTPQR